MFCAILLGLSSLAASYASSFKYDEDVFKKSFSFQTKFKEGNIGLLGLQVDNVPQNTSKLHFTNIAYLDSDIKAWKIMMKRIKQQVDDYHAAGAANDDWSDESDLTDELKNLQSIILDGKLADPEQKKNRDIVSFKGVDEMVLTECPFQHKHAVLHFTLLFNPAECREHGVQDLDLFDNQDELLRYVVRWYTDNIKQQGKQMQSAEDKKKFRSIYS
ncbi:MAG: hypothetical protein ACPGXY_00665 [Alphaproteobacteria bacterium]